MGSGDIDLDATAAVIAHGLLNTMAVLKSATDTLRDKWERLDGEQRAELWSTIEGQLAHTIDTLRALVQGLPPEAIELLDELSRKRGR